MKNLMKTVNALVRAQAHCDDESTRQAIHDAACFALNRLMTQERADHERNDVNGREACAIRHVNAKFEWGEKIPAIKWVRNELGLGLKDAKDFVEQRTYFANRPNDYYTR